MYLSRSKHAPNLYRYRRSGFPRNHRKISLFHLATSNCGTLDVSSIWRLRIKFGSSGWLDRLPKAKQLSHNSEMSLRGSYVYVDMRAAARAVSNQWVSRLSMCVISQECCVDFHPLGHAAWWSRGVGQLHKRLTVIGIKCIQYIQRGWHCSACAKFAASFSQIANTGDAQQKLALNILHHLRVVVNGNDSFRSELVGLTHRHVQNDDGCVHVSKWWNTGST